MQNSLVSVIIPTFNDGELLPIAIQSIIDQTYKNLEIIIVDDGSTDNTKGVVDSFIKKDSRVKYFTTPQNDTKRIDWRGVNINAGCFARNYGMSQAQGEWIAFQDGDDASLQNRIEIQLALAQKYQATCIITSCVKFETAHIGAKIDSERYFQDHKDIVITPKKIIEQGLKTKGILMNFRLHKYIPFTVKKWFPGFRKLFFRAPDSFPGAGNSPFFKREVFDKVQYRSLPERVWPALSGRGADRDFLFQVAETFEKSYSIKIPLYLWRVGGGYNPYPNWEKYLMK